MFFIYLLAIIAVLYAGVPLLRWLIKRIKCAGQIKKLCREKKYTLRKEKKLWFFGTRYGKKTDFVLETETQVYAVKLFGVPRRLSGLILHPERKYSIRRMMGLLLRVRFNTNTTPADFPEYAFQEEFLEEKKLRSVLLVCPKPLEVRLQDREGKEQAFQWGDAFGGMEIMTMQEFTEAVQ